MEKFNMERSTKQTYEYRKGFSDGFKEGYNRAIVIVKNKLNKVSITRLT